MKEERCVLCHKPIGDSLTFKQHEVMDESGNMKKFFKYLKNDESSHRTCFIKKSLNKEIN